METSLNHVAIPTFHNKERKAQKKSEGKKTVHESLLGFRRSRRPGSTCRRSKRKRRSIIKIEEKEKEEVEKKILALQKIVPGGESLEIEKLFEETAGYILALQYQITAMKLLSTFLEGMDKEKSKFGG